MDPSFSPFLLHCLSLFLKWKGEVNGLVRHLFFQGRDRENINTKKEKLGVLIEFYGKDDYFLTIRGRNKGKWERSW